MEREKWRGRSGREKRVVYIILLGCM